MSKPTHLVIGAGRMGGALMSGWVKTGAIKPEHIAIIDPNLGDHADAVIAAGATHYAQAPKQLPSIKVVLLAIKPQLFNDIAPSIADIIPGDVVIISVLAGTSLAQLDSVFSGHPLIRAMPNTPAAIGAGITAFTGNGRVSAVQKLAAKALLSAVGTVHDVENEHLIDVVTAVSGSGPAYVFHMVEALEAAAIRAGLPQDIAPDFARQTIIGAGALLADSALSATDLRQAVTSPNGTTQAALEVLMSETGLPPLMRDTVKAALARAKALADG